MDRSVACAIIHGPKLSEDFRASTRALIRRARMPIWIGEVPAAEAQSAAGAAPLGGPVAWVVSARSPLAQWLFGLFLWFVHGHLHWTKGPSSAALLCTPLNTY